MSDNSEQANASLQNSLSAHVNNERTGNPTAYTCPQCGGVLWQQEKEGHVEWSIPESIRFRSQSNNSSTIDTVPRSANQVGAELWR